MANYTQTRAAHQQLAASTVDVVTLDGPPLGQLLATSCTVLVVNRDGSAEIYFTVDDTAPTVGGEDCYVVPAATGSMSVTMGGTTSVVVQLVSTGTPKYSVELLA